MSDKRTPRQKVADAALREAIVETLFAYDEDDEEQERARQDGLDTRQAVLAHYVVLTARQGISDDGDTFVTYDYLLPEATSPWYQIIGLVDLVRALMDKRIRSDTSG